MSLDWYNEFKNKREAMTKLARIVTCQDNGIYYDSDVSLYGAHFVIFIIKGKYWAYRLSFPEWIDKIKAMAFKSSGKALAFAKKHKSAAYEVTKDFPAAGSIIRKEEEEEPEEQYEPETPETMEQTTFDLM